ncbi:MAG: 50S ribosomal protein L30 [Nitrospira sp.]|nr:50S ribosomal protein L30 [bacterium]MBL7049311.1 50S ribosomal protein L30 [Nitrospira sp.]
MLKVTLKKSIIGKPEKMRRVIESLGLHRIRHTVIHKDTPVIRGMIHKTSHMLEVSEVSEE